MSQAKLTSKGQITLPKTVRKHLGVDTGDKLEFIIDPDGKVVVSAKTTDIKQIYGIVKTKKHVTVEEMKIAIRKKAARRHKKQ